MNCDFSHNPFTTEKDIEEFIKDKENFLIDVFRARKETTLGYYFIKHLNKMKQFNRKKFDKLKIQLPSHMPPYISPKLLLPKNNFQQINSNFYAQNRRIMHQKDYKRAILQNQEKMQMMDQGRLNLDGTGLLTSLKMGIRGNSLNSFSFNSGLQNNNPGQMGGPKLGRNQYPQQQNKINLNLNNPYRSNSNALNMTLPSQQQKNPAMINSSNFNTANLLNRYGNQPSGMLGQNYGNLIQRKTNDTKSGVAPLIDNLKRMSKEENEKNFRQNILLSQLNLAGRANQNNGGVTHVESGYLSRSDSKYKNLKLKNKNYRSGKERIEKIFGKMKIRRKKKNTEELKEKLSQKMDKLRNMIFPQ